MDIIPDKAEIMMKEQSNVQLFITNARNRVFQEKNKREYANN